MTKKPIKLAKKEFYEKKLKMEHPNRYGRNKGTRRKIDQITTKGMKVREVTTICQQFNDHFIEIGPKLSAAIR